MIAQEMLTALLQELQNFTMVLAFWRFGASAEIFVSNSSGRLAAPPAGKSAAKTEQKGGYGISAPQNILYHVPWQAYIISVQSVH